MNKPLSRHSYRQRILSVLTLCLLALFAHGAVLAESVLTTSGHAIHYNALVSDFLTPEVATAAGLIRSQYRGLLTVSVLTREPTLPGTAVMAEVTAAANDRHGQRQAIAMREYREGSAIYYLGQFPIHHEQVLDFTVTVTPPGEPPQDIQFTQQFFID